jgi:hypothetical protein
MSKLPTSRNAQWHVSEFDQVGESVRPRKVFDKYKTILKALVRDYISIKYRKWIGKDDDPWRVPKSEKDAIWENRFPQYFTFLPDYDKEQVKKKAKEIMAIAFKTFKGKLYKKFILECKEPNWNGGEYTKQRDFWQEFKQYKESEEYLELSWKNKENSLKAMNPHHLGSCGYASKMDEFESELEQLKRLGAKPETANWEPRLVYYYMARGVHHSTDRSFSATNPTMSNLVQRIFEVTDEVRQGTHTFHRENDMLT